MSASSSSPRRLRRWFLYLAIAGAAAVGVWYFSSPQKNDRNRWVNPSWAGQGPDQASPVAVAVVEQRDLPVNLKAIGTVSPMNTVTVRSRVDGLLLRFTVEEGQWVDQGQVIAEIDPEPFRILLAQTEGQQRQNLAQLETAKADLARVQPLFEKKLITNQEMDAQLALVREREGVVAADKARVDEARLQLAYTRVTAPISGRLGLRKVDAGNLIRANDTAGLVVLTQTRPITVMFTVPEVDLQKVVEPLRAGEALVVEAWDRTERKILARGELKTVDNQIDIATGTLRLKAVFPNQDDQLFPNQFVNVQLQVSTVKDALVIPSAAVQYGSRGTYVYVITADDHATVRQIVLGPADGSQQAVSEGLKAGERVALEGLDRLREGRRVVVVENGQIVPTPNPRPPAKAAQSPAKS